MAKLFFNYGSMNSGKSAQLIMTAYNYKERGHHTMVFKPSIDNRDIGVKARCGFAIENVNLFDEKTNLVQEVKKCLCKVDCVLVDEAQFLTKDQVIELSDIVDILDIAVICYGLKTNFKGELFEGSKWLLAYADKLTEIKTICHCGNKATFVARIVDGAVVKSGKEVVIGGNDTYISLCRKHWKSGIIEQSKEL
jgi:thymidine kinase